MDLSCPTKSAHKRYLDLELMGFDGLVLEVSELGDVLSVVVF